jgi:hypothetical protein
MWNRFSCFGRLELGLAGFVTAALVDVRARTFHVDAARGDDAQDGLKPENAWRSLARVNRASLVPGDQVLFRRGQTWRGQLVPHPGDASGVITYRAFGEGAKPSVGFGRCFRAEDWQHAGQGIWATTPLRFVAVAVHTGLIETAMPNFSVCCG